MIKNLRLEIEVLLFIYAHLNKVCNIIWYEESGASEESWYIVCVNILYLYPYFLYHYKIYPIFNNIDFILNNY